MAETITPEALKKIRAEWGMTQPQFAELLSVSPDTYRRWEMTGPSAVQMPAPVAAHVATIGKLKKIYGHWDKIAAAIVRAGGTTLSGKDIITAINVADDLADKHERLWGKLFPMLNRE